MSSIYQKELTTAIAAVKRAAALTQCVAQTELSSVAKDDRSPVTVADYGAQAVIISALKREFPNDPIVGEEDSVKLRENAELSAKVERLVAEAAPEDERLQTQQGVLSAIDQGNYEGSAQGRQWALDPVDGTKGFLRRGQYAVCLALIENAEPVVGVVGCPNLGPQGGLFSAVKGQGAFWQPLFAGRSGNVEPVRISFRDIQSTSTAVFCESVESGHSALETQLAIARQLGITQPPVQMDSQAKYCSISKGDADIYLRLPVSMTYEEKIWDHASGNVLVHEAGGVVSDMYGKPLDFGQGRTLKCNKGVVAASKNIHAQVIAAIRTIVTAQDSNLG